MLHLVVVEYLSLTAGEESVDEMRERGSDNGEPSCDWRVRVAVDGSLATHGDTVRVALLYVVFVMSPISSLVILLLSEYHISTFYWLEH